MAGSSQDKKPVESASENERETPIITGTSTAISVTSSSVSSNVAARVIGTDLQADAAKSRTLQWFNKNKDKLQKYAGQWVVLEGEGVVLSEKTMWKALAAAEDRGVRSPVVVYVDPSEAVQEDAST